jgi:8-oxo-dGTP pyrophosphatase MutT (NUDIX family)
MPHIHQDIDFTISAIIVHPNKDKILFCYHPRYSYWLFPGGHIELDETPDEALLREVKEETGLDVTVLAEKPTASKDANNEIPLYQPRFVSVHEAEAPHRHVALMYVCLAKSGDAVRSDEHDLLEWKNKEEIEKLEGMPEYTRYNALTVLEEIKRQG